MVRILVLVITAITLSCGNHNTSCDRLPLPTFDLVGVLNSQIEIMELMDMSSGNRVYYKIQNDSLIINGIPILGDSAIYESKPLGISVDIYAELINNAKMLNSVNIYGCYKVSSEIGGFAFRYCSHLGGFDTKSREILLKSRIKNKDLGRSFFKAVLDENDELVMGY